jgi:predicted RNase H-like nuclease (RuvC/YqgF family)
MRWFAVSVLLFCVSLSVSPQDYGSLTPEGRMLVQRLYENSAKLENIIEDLQKSYEQQREKLLRTAGSLEEQIEILRRLRENYSELLSWSMNYYARTQGMMNLSNELGESLEKTEESLRNSWRILDLESLRDIGIGMVIGLIFGIMLVII